MQRPFQPVLGTQLCCLKACSVKRSRSAIHTLHVLVLLQVAVIEMVGLLVEQDVRTLSSLPHQPSSPMLVLWLLSNAAAVSVSGTDSVSCICWPCSVCLHHGWNVRAPDRKLVTWPREASFPVSLGLELRGWCLVRNKGMFPTVGRSHLFLKVFSQNLPCLCIFEQFTLLDSGKSDELNNSKEVSDPINFIFL